MILVPFLTAKLIKTDLKKIKKNSDKKKHMGIGFCATVGHPWKSSSVGGREKVFFSCFLFRR